MVRTVLYVRAPSSAYQHGASNLLLQPEYTGHRGAVEFYHNSIVNDVPEHRGYGYALSREVTGDPWPAPSIFGTGGIDALSSIDDIPLYLVVAAELNNLFDEYD